MKAYPNATSDAGRANASKLLANTNIQNYIAELERERLQQFNITLDDVLNEIAIVAFADIDDDNVRTSDKLKALSELKEHFEKMRPQKEDESLNKLDGILNALAVKAWEDYPCKGATQ